MVYVPTSLSGAVGDKAKGKPAPNNADDVRRVQALLKRIIGAGASFTDGLCDDKLKAAIGEFQKLWGTTPDSTIEPHGQTLKRLDRLATPLALKPITMGLVSKGGYVIGYRTCDDGPLPNGASGFTLHLLLPDERNAIDVTNRSANDLLGADNLGSVLSIFERNKNWAMSVQCKIQLRYKGTTVSTSQPQQLTAPVQPHNGRMLPLDQTHNGATLTYQGDEETKDFHGRMFAPVAGYDKYVFVWGGKFETNNDFRGFDCITYAGTTCGASNSHMAKSDDLANALNATTVEHSRAVKDPKTGKESTVKVQLEKADPAHVKEFFAATTTGYYLLFSGGHIVIVADGFVNEFKASKPSGYNRIEVAKWLDPWKTAKLTVRKLPNKPARSV